MQVNLEIKRDKQLRAAVKDMIRGAVKSVLRAEIKDLVNKTIEREIQNKIKGMDLTIELRGFFERHLQSINDEVFKAINKEVAKNFEDRIEYKVREALKITTKFVDERVKKVLEAMKVSLSER